MVARYLSAPSATDARIRLQVGGRQLVRHGGQVEPAPAPRWTASRSHRRRRRPTVWWGDGCSVGQERLLAGGQVQLGGRPVELVGHVVVVVGATADVVRRPKRRSPGGPCRRVRRRARRSAAGRRTPRRTAREDPRPLRRRGGQVERGRGRRRVQLPRLRVVVRQQAAGRSTPCRGSCGAPCRPAACRPAPASAAGTPAPSGPRRGCPAPRCRSPARAASRHPACAGCAVSARVWSARTGSAAARRRCRR